MPITPRVSGPPIMLGVFLGLLALGAGVSPASAQLPSRVCNKATEDYKEAQTRRDDAIAQRARTEEGAQVFSAELVMLETQMTAAGVAGGAPGAMQSGFAVRQADLRNKLYELRTYRDQLTETISQAERDMLSLQAKRDEACKPGFWARLIAMWSPGKGGSKVTVVSYPRTVHVYHLDRYYMPESSGSPGRWSNALIGYDSGRWMISTDRIPDSEGMVDVQILGLGTGLYRAHADEHYSFQSNTELCPKLGELKLKLEKDQVKPYGCEEAR